MPYEVRTEVFEGPFDLLLHLIARQEVDLYEVSLCAIVDAYLAELDRMGPLDLETATEFLVIAATLVELKTRRLLPETPGDVLDDDELALFEQRDLLLAQLLECKTFSQAGAHLARMLDDGARSAPRTAGPEAWFLALAPDLLAGVTPDDLARALVRAASPKPLPKVSIAHMTPIRISVGDALDELLGSPPRRRRHHLPGRHRGDGDPDRRGRALPGRPRALQAGPGRARPGPHLRRAADHVDGRRRRRPSGPGWRGPTAMARR